MLQKNRIRALCFDVDGTLNDTDDLTVERLARWLSPLRFLGDPHRMARRLVMGIETPGNWLIGLPDRFGLDDEFYGLIARLQRHAKPIRHFRLIAGVETMLAALGKRYPMSVVSARPDASTRALLEASGIIQYFVCVAGATTVEHTKPYPDPILWAAQKMGVRPDECLMIGDTTVDIHAGRAAGAQTVGVLCGFGEAAELRQAGADLILPTTAKLADVLLQTPVETSV